MGQRANAWTFECSPVKTVLTCLQINTVLYKQSHFVRFSSDGVGTGRIPTVPGSMQS